MPAPSANVLILGAGINGAAIARELALSGVGVVLVDAADLASGATAYSSRLIHGGLRYLEYGEFSLVRESLTERTRLLQLAPHFVKPLQLFVPVSTRWGGMLDAPRRFLGLRMRRKGAPQPRGLRLVQAGLGLYDLLARGSPLPRRAIHRTQSGEAPPFPAQKYPWAASYWDSQIVYPERFTLALIADARRAAKEQGAAFHVFTYCQAELAGRVARVRSAPQGDRAKAADEVVHEFQPSAIINATGAWVDATLRRLRIPSPRLMGGTKGSHLLTHHQGLREALAGRGVYAEAEDGRPVFLLPFADGTLIGTTDLPFEQSPETAVAEETEIDYLLNAAQGVFPQFSFTRDDVSLHYSGVRPLPYVDATTPAAITRRHFLKEHSDAAVPLLSVIGGKLTTCRSLAEETAALVLERLGRSAAITSRERPIPGGEDYPDDRAAEEAKKNCLAAELGYRPEQIGAVWRLCGNATKLALSPETGHAAADDRDDLPGTSLPLRFVRHSVRTEWPRALNDLVERRLLLHFHEPLFEACLRRLGELLVEAKLLSPHAVESEIDACRRRLAAHYGKRVV
jgi:glycerol-3-phosphate dehydrogenase